MNNAKSRISSYHRYVHDFIRDQHYAAIPDYSKAAITFCIFSVKKWCGQYFPEALWDVLS